GNEGARHANSWPQGKLTQPRDKALHRLWHEQGDDSSGEREHHKCEEGKREGLLRELSEDACEEGPESKTGKRETGGQARLWAAVLAELGHPCGPRTRSERNGEPAHNAAKNKSGIESAKTNSTVLIRLTPMASRTAARRPIWSDSLPRKKAVRTAL